MSMLPEEKCAEIAFFTFQDCSERHGKLLHRQTFKYNEIKYTVRTVPKQQTKLIDTIHHIQYKPANTSKQCKMYFCIILSVARADVHHLLSN